jgi:hypothetical protein
VAAPGILVLGVRRGYRGLVRRIGLARPATARSPLHRAPETARR